MSVNILESTGLKKVDGGAASKAEGIAYNSTTSGISANNVQDAIDQINEEVDGKIHTNLINPTLQQPSVYGVVYTDNGNGTFTLNGTANNTGFNVIWSEDATKYRGKHLCLCGCPSGGANDKYQIAMYAFDANGINVQAWYNATAPVSKTVPQSAVRLECRIYVYGTTTVSNLLFKPMLTTKLNATYDDFVAYSGDGELNTNVAEIYTETNSAEDALQNEGYKYPIINGVKNYTDSNGVYHKNLGVVNLGTLSWSYDSTYQRFISSTVSAMKDTSARTMKVICPRYECLWHNEQISANLNNVVYVGNKVVVIHDHTYTDATAFKNAMSGVLLFYELATPQTWNSQSEVSRVSDETHTNMMITTPTTQTVNGITCTANGDGTFTVNGTATARTFIYISPNDESNLFKAGHIYKITGCPSSGVADNLALRFWQFSSSGALRYDEDFGKGRIVTILPETTKTRFSLVIDNGLTVNNLTFKPMLTTKLDATYDDFIPYSGSGALNENVAEIYDNVLDTSDIATALAVDYAKSVSHIGMIVQSTTLDTEAKVKAIYGGTSWSMIEGRMLLGASASHAVNTTGGSETHSIAVANLPAHTHTGPSHTHAQQGTFTSSGQSANHVHDFVTNVSGNHAHTTSWQGGEDKGQMSLGSGGSGYVLNNPFHSGTNYAGDHAHSGTTTGVNVDHSHNVTISGQTGESGTGNTGSTGSGTAFNTMPPFKTVYIWERTA